MKLSATQLDVLAAVERGEVWRNEADHRCFTGAAGAVTRTVAALRTRGLVAPDSPDIGIDPVSGDLCTYFGLTDAGRAALAERAETP